jgi:hypothetical protein
MNQAAGVRGFEASAERFKNLKDARGSETGVNGKLSAKGDAFEKLHDQEGTLSGIDAEVVNGNEIGMR